MEAPTVTSFDIAGVTLGGSAPLVLIAGPCVIESAKETLDLARRLQELCRTRAMPFIFKASYDKANRTSLDSYRGPGPAEGLRVLARACDEVGVPVLADVHLPSEVPEVARVADMLQVPAFLCRQTDLLVAAGKSGKPVNIKKGQFMAPEDMGHAAAKVKAQGAAVSLTERGATFGYHDLVVDMRSLVRMRELGFPVIYDATHSVQRPGTGPGCSGGDREYILPLARAAVAAGVDGIYLEVHQQPARALSDSAVSLDLAGVEQLLDQVLTVDQARRSAGQTPLGG